MAPKYNIPSGANMLPAQQQSGIASAIGGFLGGVREGQQLVKNQLDVEDVLLQRKLDEEDRARKLQEIRLGDLAGALGGQGELAAGTRAAGTRAAGTRAAGLPAGLSAAQAAQLTLPAVIEDITAPGRGAQGQIEDLGYIVEQLGTGSPADLDLGDIEVIRETDPGLYATLTSMAREADSRPGVVSLQIDDPEGVRMAVQSLLDREEAARVPVTYNPLERFGFDRTQTMTPEAYIQLMRSDPELAGLSAEAQRAEAQRYASFYRGAQQEQQGRVLAAEQAQREEMAERVIGAVELDLQQAGISLTPAQRDELVRLYELGGADVVEQTVQRMIGSSEFRLTLGVDRGKLALQREKFDYDVTDRQATRDAIEQSEYDKAAKTIQDKFSAQSRGAEADLNQMLPQISALEAEVSDAIRRGESPTAGMAELSSLRKKAGVLQEYLDDLATTMASDLSRADLAAKTSARLGKQTAAGENWNSLYGAAYAKLMKRPEDLVPGGKGRVEEAKGQVEELQAQLDAANVEFGAGDSPDALQLFEKISALQKMLSKATDDLGATERAVNDEARLAATQAATYAADTGEMPESGRSLSRFKAETGRGRLLVQQDAERRKQEAQEWRKNRAAKLDAFDKYIRGGKLDLALREFGLRERTAEEVAQYRRDRMDDADARLALAGRAADRADANAGRELRAEVAEIVERAAKRADRDLRPLEDAREAELRVMAEAGFLSPGDRYESLEAVRGQIEKLEGAQPARDFANPLTLVSDAELAEIRRLYQQSGRELPQAWGGGTGNGAATGGEIEWRERTSPKTGKVHLVPFRNGKHDISIEPRPKSK